MEFANVYGAPPAELAALSLNARQFSPLSPGADSLESLEAGSLDGLVMLAPPGTIERRYAIAAALRAKKPGSPLLIMAPKDKVGSRLAQDLRDFGCEFVEEARRHHRICQTFSPGDPDAIAAALAAGAPRFVESLGLWSQPGVFSWDRLDAGSALLMQHLPALSGRGADFGAGLGVLAHAILTSPKVTQLTLVEIDRRALDLSNRNADDPRITRIWADVRELKSLSGLDFVVMNPPFHEGGLENHGLGQAFIQRAAAALRTGGQCWLTANRHLPYEAALAPLFKRVTSVAELGGFKIIQAQK